MSPAGNGRLSELRIMENLLPVRTSVLTSFNLAANAAEQTVRTLAPSGGSAVALYSFTVDLTDWEADGNIDNGHTFIIRIKQRIDGVNYRVVDEVVYIVGVSEVMPAFFNYVFGENNLQITVQSQEATSGVVALPVSLVVGGVVTES